MSRNAIQVYKKAKFGSSTLNRLTGGLFMSLPKWQRKGVLVIDDDEIFGQLMKGLGDKLGLPVSWYTSLEEMGSFAALADYDVVIIDYHLNGLVGSEIAEYFDVFFKNIPVVITSGSLDLLQKIKRWPAAVRAFVPKQHGIDKILNAAILAQGRPMGLARRAHA